MPKSSSTISEASSVIPIKPVNLTCEYMIDPIGIQEKNPRLSWWVQSNDRNQKQTAYRVIVASNRELLDNDQGDLWDTGKVNSDESVHVVYAGKPLASRMRCFWKVHIWCDDSDLYAASEPAEWEMGLLEPTDFSAQWIGIRTRADEPFPSLEQNHWVWWSDTPIDGPQQGYFRRVFHISSDREVREAWFLINANSLFRLYVNGFESARSTFFVPRMQWVDLTYLLEPGENTLAIMASHRRPPAGVIGRLLITFEDGETQLLDIDETWKAYPSFEEGWETPGFDDSSWGQAVGLFSYDDSPWKQQEIRPKPAPAPYLRKAFSVSDQRIASARVYATARGIYELSINGQPVSDVRFAPDWTDYNRRLMVQTYDVTQLLQQGENVIGAVLADGWYAGNVGMFGSHRYGSYPLGLLAQLEITYEDGAVEKIVTDGSWEGRSGPIVSSDMLMGEIYDARLELSDWDKPRIERVENGLNEATPGGVDHNGWAPVEILEPYDGQLVAQVGPPIRVTESIRPIAISSPNPGVVVYDMGQNMVGTIRLVVQKAKAGQRVFLRYGEMLKPNGQLYTLNLRSARQIDMYICRGDDVEVFEPRFTFHGFRYVEVRGLPGEPSLDDITGLVIHSDTPFTGHFACSHPMINQLQRNIVWGQRGNFLSVPTDCPQRDERLGWMGDAQIFVRTASFNAQTASFFTKWMIDVEDAQKPDGAYTDIAPDLGLGAGTAAWADAGVIVPWTMYLCYGDTRIIQRHYDSMVRFINYMRENSEGLIRPAKGYGDWLSIDADTPKDVIATAYFAFSTWLMARMAQVIGKEADAKRFQSLFVDIRDAFNAHFVSEDGRIKGDTQTAYLLALKMDLLSEEKRKMAVQHLAADIRRRGNRLSTGFVGCSYLLPELTDGGELDLAYTLLTSTKYPSWGYSIMQGATTMWERWDSYKADGTFQDVGMNSFNHYAYGSVGEWMYRYLAGIEIDPQQPGYKHIIIRPRPGGPITWVNARYESVRGPIEVSWATEQAAASAPVPVEIPAPTSTQTPAPTSAELSAAASTQLPAPAPAEIPAAAPAEIPRNRSNVGREFRLAVEIPANTTATVYLPTIDPDQIKEGADHVADAVGVRLVGTQRDTNFPLIAKIEIGSGRYVFTTRY